MKKIIIVLLIIVTSVCYAQKSGKDTLQNSLYKGSWSLLFEIGGNFTLRNFTGLMIAAKTHFSPEFAIRAGFNISQNVNNEVLDYKDYYGYSAADVPVNNNSFSFSFLITPLYYFNPGSRVNIFIGIGPRADYSHSYYEDYYLDYYLRYTHEDSWGIGIEGVAGVEVFPLHYLGIFGEYSVSATFGKSISKDAVKDYYTNALQEFYNYHTTYSALRADVVRFGLSLYF